MSVSSTEHLDKLAFILYDRPAGRNVIGYAIEKIEQLRADNERLREALEIERLRLAAVDSVAMADTPESAIVARQILPDYRSAALTSVERRVNEVIALRAEIERLREALVLGSEVLASHQGSAQREWHSVGAWLYPGDSINVVCAPLSEIKVEP